MALPAELKEQISGVQGSTRHKPFCQPQTENPQTKVIPKKRESKAESR